MKQGIRQSRRRGQSLVEFALLLPTFLILTMGVVDFGRYVYIRGVLNSEVIRAARLLTLTENQSSDCSALKDVVTNSEGFIDSVDPNSSEGDLAPGAGGAANLEPSTPPAGQGYVYIYPAVAPANPSTINCASSHVRVSGQVLVQTTYEFVPWTPIISNVVPQITIFATSTQTTEW